MLRFSVQIPEISIRSSDLLTLRKYRNVGDAIRYRRPNETHEGWPRAADMQSILNAARSADR